MAESTNNADQYLVEQIRSGDESAWRQLIDRFSGRLLAFARARTSSLSDAEDLVQEAFIGFLNSATHFDTSRSLETYLFTILRYKLYDLLRQKKIKTISQPDDEGEWWDRIVPVDSQSPSGIAVVAEAQREQEQLLIDLLKKLIRDYRDRDAFDDLQIIELIFFGGKRNLDVAELLEQDQKSVAGVKFRAIQKLKTFLSQQDVEALDCLDESKADVTVSRVWREHRLTCLKRSTLGSYLMEVLDEPWRSYTQFHLDVVGCSMCVANLADLDEEEEDRSPIDTERMFTSSVGFLKHSQ